MVQEIDVPQTVEGQQAGLVAEPDGSRVLRSQLSGPVADYQGIGENLAETLMNQGALAIIEKLQDENK